MAVLQRGLIAPYRPAGSRPRPVTTLALVATLVATGLGACGSTTNTVAEPASTSSSSAPASAAPDGETGPSPAPRASAHPASGAGSGPGGHDHPVATAELPAGIVPVRVEIPAIGVDATVVELDIRGSEPEVPDDFDQVGWYGLTRKPGEIGPAVLAGHIDSRQGPAVFSRLDELEPGDRVVVGDGTGNSRAFEVVSTGQYPKASLPDEVFGFGEAVPELRLITCGGVFDRSTGHYQDNYVVYARLMS